MIPEALIRKLSGDLSGETHLGAVMDDEPSRVFKSLALVGSLGFLSAACIAGGVLAGYYGDVLLGTRPALLLVGTLAGVAGSFVLTYKWIMRHVR